MNPKEISAKKLRSLSNAGADSNLLSSPNGYPKDEVFELVQGPGGLLERSGYFM